MISLIKKIIKRLLTFIIYRIFIVYNKMDLSSSKGSSPKEGSAKMRKTIAHMIVDLIMTFFFTWVWLTFVHDTSKPHDPAWESIKFTLAAVSFSGLYYYVFESYWGYIDKFINRIF